MIIDYYHYYYYRYDLLLFKGSTEVRRATSLQQRGLGGTAYVARASQFSVHEKL